MVLSTEVLLRVPLLAAAQLVAIFTALLTFIIQSQNQLTALVEILPLGLSHITELILLVQVLLVVLTVNVIQENVILATLIYVFLLLSRASTLTTKVAQVTVIGTT